MGYIIALSFIALPIFLLLYLKLTFRRKQQRYEMQEKYSKSNIFKIETLRKQKKKPQRDETPDDDLRKSA